MKKEFSVQAAFSITSEQVRDFLIDEGHEIEDDYEPTEYEFKNVVEAIVGDMSDSYYNYFDSFTVKERK